MSSRLIRALAGAAWLAGMTGWAFTNQPSRYFIRSWTTEQGLPQNAVTAIVQSRVGYLWLGSYGGLVRFDGVQFKIFDDHNSPNLTSGRVTCLFEDQKDQLWIGHESGELTVMRDGQFESVTVPRGWRGRKVVAISDDEAGDIWMINEDGLLARPRDQIILQPQSGAATGQFAFARDTTGALWVVRNGQLSRLEHGSLGVVNLEGTSSDVYIQGIAASRKGGIWISSEGLVRRWQSGRWVENWGAAPWGESWVTPMIEMHDGQLAGGTVESGLYIVGPRGDSEHFSSTNGLIQNWVRSVCEDREENLWVGVGSGGLLSVREGRVANLNPPDRWQLRSVLSVSPAHTGGFWAGTEGAGLYRFDGQNWMRYSERDGLANTYVWSVSEDRSGEVWVGTWGGGVFVKRGMAFERVPGLESLTAPTPAILHTDDGVTWIGSGVGLIRYQRGEAKIYGREQGLELPDVRAITRSPDGTIWFGMAGGGLGALRTGQLQQFRKIDGLVSDYVQSLFAEADGTLWIGTHGGGLSRLKSGHFNSISSRHGLPNNVICHIDAAETGEFWISTHGGIIQVDRDEMHRCADGLTNAIHCTVYGLGDGLPTLECSGGLQPAGCREPDGELLIPTGKGVVVIDPGELKQNLKKPPVVIEEVLVNGTSVTNREAGAAPIRLPPGSQRFVFKFTGLSFTVPEKVQFRYRLEGLESEWMEGGSSREVPYSYVPPGEYKFRVLACNNDGVWNTEGSVFAFVVLPYFWQTWWFRGLSGFASAGALVGIVLALARRRMRLKMENLERQRAIERERARIAKDIHDDLGMSLTRITMLSQSVRGDFTGSAESAEELDQIHNTARELTRQMDEIVWAVNPKHDSLDSLASYLGRFAQDSLAAAHLRCRFDVALDLPAWPVRAETRHNLFLAFKEALHNAIKHSGTDEVRIRLNLEDERLTLRVEDKGRGFDVANARNVERSAPDRYAPGNGLSNMRRRMAEIGGDCSIESQPGQGTHVTFAVPFSVHTHE